MFMSPSSYLCAQGVAENNQFFDWKESDYKAYEDSLLKALYPPVIAKTAENPERFSQQPQAFVPKAISDNTYVPTTVTIDKSKAVGEIPIQTGVSPTGAKTYTVPIQVYPGINGFEPQLSLAYNSQQGNGIVGIGWGIGGVQSIMRTSRNIYYDGKPQGALRTKADAFVLDGMRLIKISENATTINYESEQGNIKVKAFLSGDVVKYFEVFYPNGTKGIFGYASNTSNKIFYPIVSLSDLRNNQILYTYVEQENHYRLTKVAYNGASVEFQYQASRPDPLVSFIGGLKTGESYLLAKIISKLGSTALCTYSLSYKNQNNSSVLSQIDYSASGQSLNPIKLYYGEGITDGSYDNGSVTQLYNWYESTDPARIKVVKGRYDYASGADGLISLPNENPYWEHYRHSTAFQHSQNRYDNKFTGEEKIYLYAGLNSEYASPMPNLTTGANFIDIFCADLEGKQEEHIIKVNNGVSGDNDQVTFRVYRASLTVGLVSKYTRTFNFPTVLTDADGAKSIHPKFYYTGDFNGDGKQEVLAVSCHHPFGETSKTSKCYIFDLESGKVLYQSYLFPYNVNFVGTEQPDPEDAFQKTDRLLVLDYDGDGKSDIALINDSGVNIYTFDVSGSTWTGRKVSTYTGLKKVDLKDRSLLLGEINGDGLMDLLVSPKKKDPVYTWAAYNSMGDGQFYKSTFAGTQNSGISTDGFLLQDVNGDGMTDLIRYHSSGFFTYLAKKNNVGSVECAQNYTSKSILIPTNINSHNYFSQLVSLKNGVVTKYSFKRNDNKGVLATGMANSLGVVEKNTYLLMNEEAISSGTYAKGANAVFPYVDIQESIPVIAFSSTYMKGNRVDNFTFTYRGGVIHRQGLGFRGFESIFRTNLKGQLTEQYFDPYKYGILKSEVSPEAKSTYNFAVNVQANKTVKIRLSNKTEQDLLKGITATTAFVYDTYGNATQETITYTGGITVKKANTFYNNTAESGYLIGFLTDQSVTTTRNSSTYTERMNIPSHTNGYANSKVFYKNGNKAKTYEYVYDTPGNITKETLFLYGSDKGLKTEYAYDTNGRLKKVTNPLGLANEFSYNTEGRMSSEKDHRGKSTAHTYDPFGRETSVTFPDNTTATVSYGWSEEGTNALYAITRSVTGKPTTKSVYDALNREVRTAETRFNGSFLKTDKIYDSYGRVQKVSRPFAGSSATAWNIYSYDTYDRLTAISEPSGRKTTHGYSGNSITTVEDGISVKRTYDALGNLISVVDPAGTITYNLRPDGQPSSIVAPGNVTTSFGYDGFGRRTSLGDPSSGTTTYAYDASGNLLKETNANNKVINYTYDTYNRLKTATLPEFTTTYTYNGYDELTKVSSSVGTSIDYVYDALGRLSSQTETAVDNKYLRKDYTNSWKLYYIGRDYLGSITDIITEAGTKYASYNFDAWGRQRNSSSHVYIPSGQEVELFLGRGYSGHEHLKEFGLVNMNARLYDPALGRFLAPDPFVQMPDLSQNFNRYSYAMNNPLRYVDEDGEFIHIIIGAVIGGTANLIYKAVSGQLHSFKDGFAAFGIGAAAGGLGAATGGLAFAAAGGAAGGIGGFLAGAAAGSASTAVMMPVQSAGNSLYFGDQFMSLKDYGLGILGGALTGGIGNGMVAALKGNNFWTGKDVKFGRTIFSFKNTATRPAPEMRLMEASTPSVNVERPNLTATGDKISVANDHNTYTVYQGVDANGDVRYIGITSRKPEVRFSEHLNSGTNRATLDYRPIQGTGNLNKLDARIMEQKLINRYGMQKNGGSLYNLRNEIKPKFWDKHGIGKY